MPTFSHRFDAPGPARSAILTLVLAFGLLAGAPAVAQGPPVPAPTVDAGLAAEESSHDFGELVKGDPASHTFTVRNVTEEPLTIAGIIPSCGCTVVDFDRTLAPGEEGEIQVELDTMAVTGASTSRLTVYVEGTEAPALVFTLDYEVKDMLLAFPGYARWIFVQGEQEGTIRQTLWADDGAEFSVERVEPPMDAIEVSFREARPEERRPDTAGSQWIVEATLDSQAPVGAIRGYLEVHTTHPRQKVAEIPVSGFVRPTLFIEPQTGDLGTLALSAPRTMIYQVRNFATEPIELTAADTDVPGISAHLEALEEGRRYRLTLQLDPARMEEGPFRGTLRVKTDSEKVPQLSLDLNGTLVRQSAEG